MLRKLDFPPIFCISNHFILAYTAFTARTDITRVESQILHAQAKLTIGPPENSPRRSYQTTDVPKIDGL